MIEDFKKINKGIQTGFKSVYFTRIRCPMCKEKIFANALMCPNCKTDFTKPPFVQRLEWQSKAMNAILVLSAIISITICFNGVSVFLGIIIGLALYGLGYVFVQKIQSFKNYHYK